MSQVVTLELSDELYAALEQAAQADAQSPDAWLLAHLPDLLPTPVNGDAKGPAHGLWTAEEEAQFAAEEATFEVEWQQHLAEIEELRRRPPPSAEEAYAHVVQTLQRWSPTYLPVEEVLELALSEEIAEENLNSHASSRAFKAPIRSLPA